MITARWLSLTLEKFWSYETLNTCFVHLFWMGNQVFLWGLFKSDGTLKHQKPSFVKHLWAFGHHRPKIAFNAGMARRVFFIMVFEGVRLGWHIEIKETPFGSRWNIKTRSLDRILYQIHIGIQLIWAYFMFSCHDFTGISVDRRCF